MWVGTFHGLANRLLRTHYREAGLPQSFQILDSQDQLSAIKRLMKAMNVDTEKYEPKKVQRFINSNKEAGHRARDAEAYDEYSMRLAELYEAYDAQCQREGVADFPELLLRSYELLYRNEPLREHYRDRFKHILIDEFQDTNTLQYRWLKLFAGPRTALFAVGDDDQSIYAFRGANTANMAEFEREFAHGNVIKLEQNYRSHGHILTAANTLISQNAHRLGKNLWTAEGEGEPIRVYEAYSDQDEASFVVDEVRALNREGAALSDMALLYRSNAQSRVLEHALFSASVPYRVYGGLRFFERQEIKHALAYLRLLTNPEDDGAFFAGGEFPHSRHRRTHPGATGRQRRAFGHQPVAGGLYRQRQDRRLRQADRGDQAGDARPALTRGDRPCDRSQRPGRLLPCRQGRRRPPGKPQ